MGQNIEDSKENLLKVFHATSEVKPTALEPRSFDFEFGQLWRHVCIVLEKTNVMITDQEVSSAVIQV